MEGWGETRRLGRKGGGRGLFVREDYLSVALPHHCANGTPRDLEVEPDLSVRLVASPNTHSHRSSGVSGNNVGGIVVRWFLGRIRTPAHPLPHSPR